MHIDKGTVLGLCEQMTQPKGKKEKKEYDEAQH